MAEPFKSVREIAQKAFQDYPVWPFEGIPSQYIDKGDPGYDPAGSLFEPPKASLDPLGLIEKPVALRGLAQTVAEHIRKSKLYEGAIKELKTKGFQSAAELLQRQRPFVPVNKSIYRAATRAIRRLPQKEFDAVENIKAGFQESLTRGVYNPENKEIILNLAGRTEEGVEGYRTVAHELTHSRQFLPVAGEVQKSSRLIKASKNLPYTEQPIERQARNMGYWVGDILRSSKEELHPEVYDLLYNTSLRAAWYENLGKETNWASPALGPRSKDYYELSYLEERKGEDLVGLMAGKPKEKQISLLNTLREESRTRFNKPVERLDDAEWNKMRDFFGLGGPEELEFLDLTGP